MILSKVLISNKLLFQLSDYRALLLEGKQLFGRHSVWFGLHTFSVKSNKTGIYFIRLDDRKHGLCEVLDLEGILNTGDDTSF